MAKAKSAEAISGAAEGIETAFKNGTEALKTGFDKAVKNYDQLLGYGKDTVEAWMFSLESYKNRFLMNIDGYRIGPGLGGSIGVAIVIGTGGPSPGKFNGVQVSGFDFQANLGGRWGAIWQRAPRV